VHPHDDSASRFKMKGCWMKVISQILPKIGCHGNVPWEIKKEVQIDYLHPKRFHLVKRLQKSVQRILNASMPNERISYNFGTLFIFYPTLTQKLLNRFSPFFTRCRAISGAINVIIRKTIVHPVLKCQGAECSSIRKFCQKWLPWQRPLRYQKRGPD